MTAACLAKLTKVLGSVDGLSRAKGARVVGAPQRTRRRSPRPPQLAPITKIERVRLLRRRRGYYWRGMGAIVAACLVVSREGEGEFEDLVVDKDAEVELVGVFGALEPDGAGGFFAGGEGGFDQGGGLVGLGLVGEKVGSGDDDSARVRGGADIDGGGWGDGTGLCCIDEMSRGFGETLGILIAEGAEARRKFVEREGRRIEVDLRVACVGDGDVGAEFPAGVLQRNLNGNAVGGEGFDHGGTIIEVIGAGSAQLPAGDAVGVGCSFDGLRRRERSCERCGEIHARDVAGFAVGGADFHGVA